MLLLKRFSVNVVLSGSMEPALKTGGIIFTDTKKTMPGIGDIITYRMDDMLVTHRVTDKRDSAYITRGDANEGEDAAPVMQEQIVGTVVFFYSGFGICGSIFEEQTRIWSYQSYAHTGIVFSWNAMERSVQAVLHRQKNMKKSVRNKK